MTATILPFTPRGKAQPAPRRTITRTPELAFILAILDALPTKTKQKARTTVMLMAERTPDCEASQAAADLAAMLVIREGK